MECVSGLYREAGGFWEVRPREEFFQGLEWGSVSRIWWWGAGRQVTRKAGRWRLESQWLSNAGSVARQRRSVIPVMGLTVKRRKLMNRRDYGYLQADKSYAQNKLAV